MKPNNRNGIQLRFLVCLLALGPLIGCSSMGSSIGDFLIPAHADSLAKHKAREVLRLWESSDKNAAERAAADTAAALADTAAALAATAAADTAAAPGATAAESRAAKVAADAAAVAADAAAVAAAPVNLRNRFADVDWKTAVDDCFMAIRPLSQATVATPPPGARAIGGPAAGFVADTLVPLAIKALTKTVEKEAKKYSATYSARDSGLLIDTIGANPGTITQKISCLSFVRTVKGRGKAAKDEPVMGFLAKLEVSEPIYSEGFRVVPIYYRIERTKSKVAGISKDKIRSFLFPWMGVYWVWSRVDSDLNKVDVAMKINLRAIRNKKEGRVNVPLREIDVPLGKIEMGEGAVTRGEDKLRTARTGYIPMPNLGPSQRTVPLDITISVVEKNDLGDVIGKQANKLKKSEEDNIQKGAGYVRSLFGAD